MRRSSSTSIFQTRCTEEMDIFSRKVWILHCSQRMDL